MDETTGLPENAFRELAPGEAYRPVVPSSEAPPEVTVRSVAQGLVWAVVFSAAATYLALKLGQGIESAIPISILAVGVSGLLAKGLRARPSSLLENVQVLAVGATSGIVAGGSQGGPAEARLVTRLIEAMKRDPSLRVRDSVRAGVPGGRGWRGGPAGRSPGLVGVAKTGPTDT